MALSGQAEVLARMGVDLVAIAALVYGLFLPRHRQMDLVVVFALFNIGLFLALVVISAGEVGIGVGFGLFAVLSIVRLRSEPFSHRELAYFFIALVLALVCAIDLGNLAFTGTLAALALIAAWAIDHPRISRPVKRVSVTLEQAFNDGEPLRRHLQERLQAHVLEVTVLEIDYVRETTRVDVRYRPVSAVEAPEETIDVAVLVP